MIVVLAGDEPIGIGEVVTGEEVFVNGRWHHQPFLVVAEATREDWVAFRRAQGSPEAYGRQYAYYHKVALD